MADDRPEVEAYLHELGLSEYESDAYMTLLTRGILTAGDASEAGDIPQSRIYDVFDSLQRKGFVKVQQGRPKKYGAIDPETAVDRYCEYRREEFESELTKTQVAGEFFVEAFSARSDTSTGHDDMDVFWSYRGKDRLLDHFGDLCADVESELLMMTAGSSFERIVSYYKELLAELAADGVDVRLLVSDADEVSQDVWEKAQEWSSVVAASGIAGRVYLIDGETVILAFRTDADTQFVGVVVHSIDLYETMANFFALKWEQHAGEPPRKRA